MDTLKLKLFPIVCLLLILGSCARRGYYSSTAFRYRISGKIEGSKDGDTVLLGVAGFSRRINTAIIKNSQFRFTGVMPELSMGRIQYKASLSIIGSTTFVIEREPLVIEAQVKPDDPDHATGRIVKAGKQNEDFQKLEEIKGQYLVKSNPAENGGNNLEKLRQAREQFIKEHPTSIAGLYDLYDMSPIELKLFGAERILATLDLFDKEIKHTSLWKRAKEQAKQYDAGESKARLNSE